MQKKEGKVVDQILKLKLNQAEADGIKMSKKRKEALWMLSGFAKEGKFYTVPEIAQATSKSQASVYALLRGALSVVKKHRETVPQKKPAQTAKEAPEKKTRKRAERKPEASKEVQSAALEFALMLDNVAEFFRHGANVIRILSESSLPVSSLGLPVTAEAKPDVQKQRRKRQKREPKDKKEERQRK